MFFRLGWYRFIDSASGLKFRKFFPMYYVSSLSFWLVSASGLQQGPRIIHFQEPRLQSGRGNTVFMFVRLWVEVLLWAVDGNLYL